MAWRTSHRGEQSSVSDSSRFCSWISCSFRHSSILYKCDDFYHPNDEGGLAWNDPEIGIVWPKLAGKYKGSASGDGYFVDGVMLNLSEKDQHWLGIKDIFKF